MQGCRSITVIDLGPLRLVTSIGSRFAGGSVIFYESWTHQAALCWYPFPTFLIGWIVNMHDRSQARRYVSGAHKVPRDI